MQPKPVVVAALQPGCSTAQCSAHKVQMDRDNTQNAINNQHGGATSLTPASVTCPQVAMHGMQETPNDANQQSCDANGTKAQGHSNAQYDSQVGKLPPKAQSGGIVYRRRHRRSNRRRSNRRRNTRRRSTRRRSTRRRSTRRRSTRRQSTRRRR
jgi:hypothetical protein